MTRKPPTNHSTKLFFSKFHPVLPNTYINQRCCLKVQCTCFPLLLNIYLKPSHRKEFPGYKGWADLNYIVFICNSAFNTRGDFPGSFIQIFRPLVWGKGGFFFNLAERYILSERPECKTPRPRTSFLLMCSV